jgi:hypothetical protein
LRPTTEGKAGLLKNIRRYIQFYDGVTRTVAAHYPHLKFVGACMAGRGNELDALVWRTFLDKNEHAEGTPLDAVAYHLYIMMMPPGMVQPPRHEWNDLILADMPAKVNEARQSALAIKQTSPSTQIFMNEIGICNTCAQTIGWYNMDSTLGTGPNSTWSNLNAVAHVAIMGELGAAGVDMVGASQLLGWPAGKAAGAEAAAYASFPVGVPFANKSIGSPYQPQVTANGNCPEMSLLSWKDGTGNARYWLLKMLAAGIGNGLKEIHNITLTTSSTSSNWGEGGGGKQSDNVANVNFFNGRNRKGMPKLYAKGFAPKHSMEDTGKLYPTPWPGPTPRAVLLANMDSVNSYTANVDGLNGGEIWSITHAISGFGITPYAKEQASNDQVVLPPLGVALCFLI